MSKIKLQQIRFVFIVALLFISFSFTNIFPGLAQNIGSNNKNDELYINKNESYVPDRVVVKYMRGIDIFDSKINRIKTNNRDLDTILYNQGITKSIPLFANKTNNNNAIITELSQIHTLQLKKGSSVNQAIKTLSASPFIEWAEPDYLAYPIITNPNDPLFSEQWGLDQIQSPDSWDTETGNQTVVIAVIDSGIDLSHQDLSGKFWINPGEIAGNGIDDDNNGFIDDRNGWDFVNSDNDPMDDHGHGTQVAGVIAAQTNNSIGIAGVCWGCQLMAVKVMNSGGIANYSDIASGILYAAQKGAEVINVSLGGYSDSSVLKSAINTASNKYGSVIVAGAGNDNSENPFYPAAYDEVLGVSGLNEIDSKSPQSNYGDWVDISAPSVGITTTFLGGGYGDANGTSLAASFVSGLAGLLRSNHNEWSESMVRTHIAYTTDDIDSINPGYEGKLGSGRLNANSAINEDAQFQFAYESHTVDGILNGLPEPGSTIDLDVTIHNLWADASDVNATLASNDPYVSILTNSPAYGNIQSLQSGTNDIPFRISVSSSAPFAHDLNFNLTITAQGGFSDDISFSVTTKSGIQNVGGLISIDTTWTKKKEYRVTGNILVQEGVTLTIEPGTKINIDSGKLIQVNGELIAIGKPDQMIVFTSDSGWVGIKINDNSVDAIVDGDFQYLSGSTMQYTIIEKADTGILCANSSPYLGYNVIRDNNLGILAGESAAYGFSQAIVAHNSIMNNNAGLQTGNARYVAYNRIIDNLYWGVYADWGGPGSIDFFQNNLIANNGGVGLTVWPQDTLTIRNNTIIQNDIGIKWDWGGDPSATFYDNNIVRNLSYDFEHAMNSGINISSNWWGTTNSTLINKNIYDFYDDFSLGIADYESFLTTPNSNAPAYVVDVDILPDTTLGIQTATFKVYFNRPMEIETTPEVAFYTSDGSQDYPITNNALWVNESTWQATYDFSSLIARGDYYLRVNTAIGTDGIEIVPSDNYHFTVDYAGAISDTSPPWMPIVTFCADNSLEKLSGIWDSNDPESNIDLFRFSLGTSPGRTDVINWTYTTNKSFSLSNLNLLSRQEYYLAVQARNQGGIWSLPGISNAVQAGSDKCVSNFISLPLILKK